MIITDSNLYNLVQKVEEVEAWAEASVAAEWAVNHSSKRHSTCKEPMIFSNNSLVERTHLHPSLMMMMISLVVISVKEDLDNHLVKCKECMIHLHNLIKEQRNQRHRSNHNSREKIHSVVWA